LTLTPKAHNGLQNKMKPSPKMRRCSHNRISSHRKRLVRHKPPASISFKSRTTSRALE
jgi:hypothetical protein